MNLAVVIVTYQRKDGKTPFYLKRALDSVFSRQHKDFKIFLIGDHYENNNEWSHLVRPYHGDRFYCINLDVAKERDSYKDKMLLWCTGGLTAYNIGINKAIEEGFEYICHLDHDDYWGSNHLQTISYVIEETKADWLCTRSLYGNSGTLPKVPDMPENEVISFVPAGGNVIHSSTCYNYKTIPLRVENTFEKIGIALPADADLWDRSAVYIRENNLKSVFINKTTCYHIEEGYTLR